MAAGMSWLGPRTFFRFDPLILLTNLLTLSPLVKGLLWSLVFVGLTLVLGRFFCGWVCPWGPPWTAAAASCSHPGPTPAWPNACAGSSITCFSSSWGRGRLFLDLVGLFDPLSLLFRSLALVFYPALGYAAEKSSLVLYRWGLPFTYVSEPAYQFLKATILPLKPRSTCCRSVAYHICPGRWP